MLYTESDLAAVIATLPPEVQADGSEVAALEQLLLRAGYAYHLEMGREGGMQKDAETRAQLEALLKSTNGLLMTLAGTNRWVLAEVFDQTNEPWPDTIDQLIKLHRAVSDEIETMQARKRPGRRRSSGLSRYVEKLMLIWESCSGQRAGYTQVAYPCDVREQGPFLDFVEAAARPVLGTRFTRSMFVEAIKRKRREENFPT